MLKRIAAVALAVAMLSSTSAFAGEPKDVVDTAVGAGQFSTLVAAVKASRRETGPASSSEAIGRAAPSSS